MPVTDIEARWSLRSSQRWLIDWLTSWPICFSHYWAPLGHSWEGYMQPALIRTDFYCTVVPTLICTLRPVLGLPTTRPNYSLCWSSGMFRISQSGPILHFPSSLTLLSLSLPLEVGPLNAARGSRWALYLWVIFAAFWSEKKAISRVDIHRKLDKLTVDGPKGGHDPSDPMVHTPLHMSVGLSHAFLQLDNKKLFATLTTANSLRRNWNNSCPETSW